MSTLVDDTNVSNGDLIQDVDLKKQRIVKIRVETENNQNCKINGSIKMSSKKSKRKSIDKSVLENAAVPDALLSCLDDLQNDGKLLSWKLKGEGQNLTVKVTWNKKRNQKVNRMDIAVPSEVDSGLETSFNKNKNQLQNSAKLSQLTLNRIQNDKIIKNEFKKFTENFNKFFEQLKNQNLLITEDQHAFDKLQFQNKMELSSIITTFVQTLHMNLSDTNLNTERLEYDIKLIVIAEIEDCLKLEFGSLLKQVEDSIQEDDYPRAFDDQLSSLVLLKIMQQQKLHRSDSSESSNSKRLFPSSNNLVLSLNSLTSNESQVETNDIEVYKKNEYFKVEREENVWEDNWSFSNERKNHAQIFNDSKIPIVMAIPEPNKEVLTRVGDQDIESLSDTTLNDNEETSDIEETSVKKFPLPENLMLSGRMTTSFYNPNSEKPQLDIESGVDNSIKESKSKDSFINDTSIEPDVNIVDPKFIVKPDDRLVRIGESVKFKCKVDGSRPMLVFWFRMDEEEELQNNEKYEIFHDDEFNYLKIYNTVQNDAGTYLCVVSNELQQNFTSFSLKLRDNNRPFIAPKFLDHMSDVDIEEGKVAVFKLKVDFGYPKARILFYRNESLILNELRHHIYYLGDGLYELYIQPVNDNDNAQYSCVCINNGGKDVSRAELYVLEKEIVEKPENKLEISSFSRKSIESIFRDSDSVRSLKKENSVMDVENNQEIYRRQSSQFTDHSFEIQKTFSVVDDENVNSVISERNSISLEPTSLHSKNSVSYLSTSSLLSEKPGQQYSSSLLVTNLDQKQNFNVIKENIDDEIFHSYISQIQIDYKPNESATNESVKDKNTENEVDDNNLDVMEQVKDTQFHLDQNEDVFQPSLNENVDLDDEIDGVCYSRDPQIINNENVEDPIIVESNEVTPSGSEDDLKGEYNLQNDEPVLEPEPTINKVPESVNEKVVYVNTQSNIFERNTNVKIEVIENKPPVEVSVEVEKPPLKSEDALTLESLENSNIVKMLKQKFDKKDEKIKKVASLTCRNVIKKNNFKETFSALPEPIKSDSSSTCFEETKQKQLFSDSKSVSASASEIRTSTTSIASSTTTTSVNDTDIDPNNESPRKNINKFIKVYDSMNDNQKTNKSDIDIEQQNDNTRKKPAKDFKHLVETNYATVRRKDSIVISKVKLWDKRIESGELSPDNWDKQFLPS